MKRIILCALSALLLASHTFAQTQTTPNNEPREKAAVLNFDTHGLTFDPAQMGAMARLEFDKIGMYEVMDRYDVAYMLEREKLSIDNCYGKICLVEMGKKLKMDKMLTGAVEVLGERIVVTIRLIDVGTETVEKSQVEEFLNLKPQVQAMLAITMQKMFGKPVDEAVYTKLTKPNDYESTLNVPEMSRLNLGGPRMGTVIFSGEYAAILRRTERQGGLDATPVMFQFGYQFEKAYLNQGRLQALFEVIPNLTGLDQGLIIPSLSILHGVRDNRTGLEFAFGPTMNLTREAEGIEEGGTFVLLNDWVASQPAGTPIPNNVVTRFDKRGEPAIGTGFVFAGGKSFKSGRLNIPVNVFFIPGKYGHRYGISVGFNGRG